MSDERPVMCIGCGQPVDGQRINTLSSGTPCPTCRDRILEAQPALLPRLPRVGKGPQQAQDEAALPLRKVLPEPPEPDDEPPLRA